jgi:asparaginyl-tRNA synthetase
MIDEKTMKVLKIRAKVLDAARYWLNDNDYVEVQGPTIIPAVGDWPGYFEVKYFDKKAYLAQGLQPYADDFVASFGRVFTIAPSFRVERYKTKRHLTEYWRIEVAQRCSLDSLIGVQEKLLSHICRSLIEEDREQLKLLRGSIENLANASPPFPKLSYDDVIDTLQKDGYSIVWGQKLDWELEKHLSSKLNSPFFITEFPIGIQSLFYKSHPEKAGVTLSVDLLAPDGYGEIGGGGQMVDEKKSLLKKMSEEKIDPNDQRWYLNLRRLDVVPNSGFMIGVERLIQWICKLEYISDALAFPRTPDSIYP